jgi:hypothetical protein
MQLFALSWIPNKILSLHEVANSMQPERAFRDLAEEPHHQMFSTV